MKLGRDYQLLTFTERPWRPGDLCPEPYECRFSWNGRAHRVIFDQIRFPITITRRGKLRPATAADDFWRLGLALRGKWRSEYQIGDESPNKPGIGEWFHAGKNALWTEPLRRWEIWNRGAKPWWEPDGYDKRAWKPINKEKS